MSSRALKDQLRYLDEQLTSLIALADEQRDYLLGALLCEAHAHVVKQYTVLASN
ncbi:hypothetical protein [Sphingomonas bacterium]|uniref:hypothetical protein n=1 Tax=Sphingomonas bacterium TaxID=1895847 RepID=UPI001C2D3964|nr:hypothetical protein [Sphingomonas bacterium]